MMQYNLRWMLWFEKSKVRQMLKVTVNYVARWDGFNIFFFEKQIMEYLITERQFKFVDACL